MEQDQSKTEGGAAVRSSDGLYRVHTWENLKSGEPAFGIQRRVKHGARHRWLHCACDGEAVIYKHRETAERHVRWLNDPQGTEPEWNDDLVV